MTLEEAKVVLGKCVRHEMRDLTFGDTEVTWMDEDTLRAEGYFGGENYVSIYGLKDPGVVLGRFDSDEARTLLACGSDAVVSRNDTSGPSWGY